MAPSAVASAAHSMVDSIKAAVKMPEARSAAPTTASSDGLGHVPIIDLYSGTADSLSPESAKDKLRQDILAGLRGLDQPMIPGKENDAEDRSFAYRRTLPTVILYDEQGLLLYDKLTTAPEYYLYNAELEVLREFGPEIARRIFGYHTLPASRPIPESPKKDERQEEPRKDDGGGRTPSNAGLANGHKEKWGDQSVGKFNGGVNAEEGLDGDRAVGAGSLVELGAGSLRKTIHLIRALELLPPTARGPSVNYYALDLDKAELNRTLDELRTKEARQGDEGGWTVLDGKVALHGMWADYDAGLDFIGRGGLAKTPGGDEDGGTEGPRCLMWLGSSIGNFDRKSAADFLSKTAANSMRPQDTMLISMDRRNKPADVALAYNDPAGLTRDFIMNGIEHADRVLGGGVLDRAKFEYHDRYNSREGRHESYYRSKVDQEIAVPGHEGEPIRIAAGELIHMESSYKYSEREALDLFDYSGLRVVQKWTDRSGRYDVWLVEKPQFHFSNSRGAQADAGVAASVNGDVNGERAGFTTDDGWANSGVDQHAQRAALLGLPGPRDWAVMWEAWDTVTLSMIPPSMLHEKPIDLRHICLFYLGHIPAFLDIHVSRHLDEPHTNERYSSIFERGIDPHMDDETQCNPHSEVPTRPEDWPTLQEILEYKAKVAARVQRIYDGVAAGTVQMDRRLARMLWMTLEHIALHLETLLYMLSQSSSTLPPAGFIKPDWATLKRDWDNDYRRRGGDRALQQLIKFEAGSVILGHDDDDSQDFDIKATRPTSDIADLNAQLGNPEFGWDNEHPRRKVETGAFKISAMPITNGQFAEFLSATGSADAPASWVEVPGRPDRHVRTVYGPVEMDVAKHWPVQASGAQLAAYARWKGGRLPTQPELRRFLDAPPEALVLDLTVPPFGADAEAADDASVIDPPGKQPPPARGSAVKYVPREQQSDEDLKWMAVALTMAQEAADAKEVPVGGVFVRNGEIIVKARNRTNELMDATRHAELEAIDYILSTHPPKSDDFPVDPHSCLPGDNPFKDTTLYVTIEPCLMCGAALRQVGIQRVVFGAGNERFGGNGSVLGLHDDDALVSSPGYESVGGYYRDEAIMMLRRFYITENQNAPKPQSKARRLLKTEIQPPGISMHGPGVAAAAQQQQQDGQNGSLPTSATSTPSPRPGNGRRGSQNPTQAQAAPCANVGFRNWHPVPASLPRYDSDGTLLPGHNGGVWEWTSTPFMGFDGFRPAALYPGYSADFFDGKHSVVLGGSWATVPSVAGRRSVVNTYQTTYPYIFGGARVVFDE
ncbi:uncharacterized protein PFL1_00505 [Pseudozyma flocculosa PF-1]|uniref:Related to TAD2 - tRNA-specific adenosine deaminase 2 n=1 Tax=Pseudozyma flocculosa TaxID=84751 RepID=A0A5C3EQY7_9BASI|nr:uncharacterized protein PFL1_00505 [Pseudozyma flocculosa PF-1]EPQ32309.1 hypothetical protein PFL1_00505 [Pseudozyma flocculosa PF-1]SPO34733.1 related to TAD2 - tRNA-specific adenosine deaminase 2 [Pseudozyma flocculosa]